MGLETALIASTVLSVGTSIYGGIQQKKEADRQAQLVNEQAHNAAQQEIDQGKRYRNRQVVAYLKNGVAVDTGSPLMALQETLDTANTNARNIVASGNAQSAYLRKVGKNALMGGIMQGVSSAASGYTQYGTLKAAGYIGNVPAYNTVTGSNGTAATRSANGQTIYWND